MICELFNAAKDYLEHQDIPMNGVPHYIGLGCGNKKRYDTSKARLLAYKCRNRMHDIGGRGIYFSGLYVTAKGNYFEYNYKHNGRSFKHEQSILSFDGVGIGSVYNSLKLYPNLLITPEEKQMLLDSVEEG